MSPALIGATAVRVLGQIRRDPRTVALLVLVPCLLVTLFRFVLDGSPGTFDRVGLPLVGIFPLISMFLVTSITMLRERTGGTLERLMTMPIAKADLLLGYAAAFALLALVQAVVVTAVAVGLLGLDVAGPLWQVVLLAVANALLGMASGLFVSAFAGSEFQAVQFMPAFIFPQLVLCGVFAPRSTMPPVLDAVAGVLPMTYAYEGLARVARGEGGRELAVDVAVVLGASLVALGLGAATLRRRTA